MQTTTYDFVAQAPSASWANNDGGLVWGSNGTAGVCTKTSAVLENGTSYPSFLSTQPKATANGSIQGTYTVTIPDASLHPTVTATFGFKQGATGTDGVTFRLATQVNGTWVYIFKQTKTYTGALSTVAADLSAYGGQTIQLFLTADGGATPDYDWAAWTDVRITADSATTPTSCSIGGVNYADGAVNPALSCQICDPNANASAWTTQGDSCLIGGQCYTAGTLDGTGCSICEPVTSQTGWTPQATCNTPGTVLVQNYDGTAMGTLQATSHGNTFAFLGVPYAATPTGANRFAPPKPATSWTGVRNAFTQPPPCAQKGFFPGLPNGYIGSEDCLYLNVWSPKTATSSSNLPVLVFQHGGGLMFGGTAAVDDVVGQGVYDGNRLAAAQNMVVVTIQTRLAALGYLASTELSADATSKTNPTGSTSGNYGLLDALQALKWIKKNIVRFGGDPNHVTIAGQSGGSTLVNTLLSSPLAKDPADNKPYFASAFLMSGFYEEPTMATRYTQAAAIMPALKAGCTDNSTPVKCLRTAPVSNFVNAAGDFLLFIPNLLNGRVTPDLAFGLPFGPNVDGYVVPNEPRTTYAAGQHQKVPVIMGSTQNEFATFMVIGMAGALKALQTLDIRNMIYVPTCRGLNRRANLNLGATLASAALPLYPCSGLFVGPTMAYAKAMTHAQYECPVRRTARALVAGQTEPVRRYLYNHRADRKGAFQNLFGLLPQIGAAHALDVMYLFNTHESKVLGLRTYFGPSPREVDLTTRYQIMVRNFVATGDPNCTTSGSCVATSSPNYWAAYDGPQDNALNLKAVGETGPSDPGPQMISGIDTSYCDFWDANFALNTPTTCTPSCSGKVCGADGCGGTCGTCGSGTQCNEGQTACVGPTASVTVSGFTSCTCLNGTFQLTDDGTGLYSSKALTNCPGQTQPAYLRFNQSTLSFGVTDEESTPGTGNSDLSQGTITSSGTTAYTVSGNGATSGNISSFCPGIEDQSMQWTLSKAPTQLTNVTYYQSTVDTGRVAASYPYMNDGNANGSTNGNQTSTAMGFSVNPSFIAADAGAAMFIDHIVVGYDYLNNLIGGVSRTEGLTVQGSVDGATWTTITTLPTYASTGSNNGLVSVAINGTWRTLRLLRGAIAGGYAGVLEFQLWGTTPSVNKTPLPAVTYSQSDVYNARPGNVAASYQYMNDANANGSTSNGQTLTTSGTNRFIKADAGASTYVDHIVVGYDYLFNLPNSGPGSVATQCTEGLVVEVSNDNATWTSITTLPVYSNYGGSIALNGLYPVSIKGTWRYIRLRRPTNYFAGVLEFSLWPTP